MTEVLERLADGDIRLHGRVMPASNATFVGEVTGLTVVYKPVSGERPLWDFPDGTLAERERAAYVVSEALGWRIVPPTILRDGPHGPGMVQLWREPSEDRVAVDIVAEGEVPPGWCEVFDGVDSHDRVVTLVHEDTPALRRIAVFDVLVNNADRKGGHVLARDDGHRYGVDHGLTFHSDPKLRTVLWGWLDQPLIGAERAGIETLLTGLTGDLGDELSALLTRSEVDAFERRCRRLRRQGRLPAPAGNWPAIPWPPF